MIYELQIVINKDQGYFFWTSALELQRLVN